MFQLLRHPQFLLPLLLLLAILTIHCTRRRGHPDPLLVIPGQIAPADLAGSLQLRLAFLLRFSLLFCASLPFQLLIFRFRP